MRNWYIQWHSEEIYGSRASMVVEEVPLWAYFISRSFEWFDSKILRDFMCNPPSWAYRIPTTTLKWDEEYEWRRDNLSLRMRAISGWFVFMDHRHSTRKERIPLADEWCIENDFTDPFESLYYDEDVNKCHGAHEGLLLVTDDTHCVIHCERCGEDQEYVRNDKGVFMQIEASGE